MKARLSAAGLDLERREVGPGLPAVYAAADPDALLGDLDEETFRASDERMPYFATLWPAGRALARHVGGEDVAGLRVLDLGCGVGAVGLAATAGGARSVFLDWEPRALDLVREAADAQGLEVEALLAADWRDPPRMGTFDRVLAADVLYEARNVEPLARFLQRHLAPGAEAWVADPGRPHATGFPSALACAGLRLREERPLAGGAQMRLFVACA